MSRGRRQDSPTQDRLADLLAEGLSTGEAAKVMGIAATRARKLLVLIRKRLGPQAV